MTSQEKPSVGLLSMLESNSYIMCSLFKMDHI
jgi:hypothetical protein